MVEELSPLHEQEGEGATGARRKGGVTVDGEADVTGTSQWLTADPSCAG